MKKAAQPGGLFKERRRRKKVKKIYVNPFTGVIGSLAFRQLPYRQ